MKSFLKKTIFAWLILALVSCNGLAPEKPKITQPNIIFILTDDMTYQDIEYMPKTQKLLGQGGASFSQFIVTMSLCCPSRASILRGQYPHNSGITGNNLPEGGFEKAYSTGLEKSTIAVWLQNAGYRTVLIGKYLNGYPANASQNYIPPGWTEWFVPAGDMRYNDSAYSGFNYLLNENGNLVQYGDQPEDYTTDVFAAKAINFIKSNKSGQPFFAYIAPYVPHRPSTPAPRHADLFADIQLADKPSINEADTGDKARFFQTFPELTPEQLDNFTQQYRRRIQSLQAVDEMVEAIYTALVDSGQIDKTYIFFASDNGYHIGEHRLLPGKNTPFEEDIHVPLLVRGPDIQPGLVISNLASTIDLAPTFAELTGVSAPDFIDGRSLAALLRQEQVPEWRNAIYIARGISNTNFSTSMGETASNGNLITTSSISGFISEQEPSDSLYDKAPSGQFFGMRTEKYTYIRFLNGDVELYDNQNDPYQLENIAPVTDLKLLKNLQLWLKNLKTCKADSCRQWDMEPTP